MSVRTPQSTAAESEPAYDYSPDQEAGIGWVMFAGTLLAMLGTINIIEGIAAIGNAHFFVHNANYVIGSLNTWGWVALCIGAVQLVAGLGVFVKNQFARWVGVAALGLNSIAQLMMMPAYPFWSLCLFAVDLIAMYGLIAYGKRITEAW